MKNQNQFGYVMLGGRKIYVSVKMGKTSRWVSERSGRVDMDAPHLPSIERKLKKMHGAQEKLLNAKVLAV